MKVERIPPAPSLAREKQTKATLIFSTKNLTNAQVVITITSPFALLGLCRRQMDLETDDGLSQT